jgi:dTDP-glucose 4,6-dehydratase
MAPTPASTAKTAPRHLGAMELSEFFAPQRTSTESLPDPEPFLTNLTRGVLEVLRRGRPGERYNLGGRSERTNLQIVDAICDILESELPAAANPALAERGIAAYRELRKFVADRPGHDRRYAIDDAKIQAELGWAPRQSFEEGLRATVRWYLGHRAWCEAVQTNRYGRERLGLGAKRESEVQAG